MPRLMRRFSRSKEDQTMRRFTTAVGIFTLAFACLLGLAMARPVETTDGKLVAVYPDKQAFVVADGKGSKNFELDKNGKVFINEKPGKLSDLMAGEFVQVIWEKQVDKLVASEVRCQRF
jgi:hypothetical protein